MGDQKNDVSLEGVLERITFYNEENGFLIGKLKGADKIRGDCRRW